MKPDHPQRIVIPFPAGGMLKRQSPRAFKTKVCVARERNERYLALVRQCPCLKCGLDPCGIAAHVRLGSAAYGKKNHGMGSKPDDRWAVPLCQSCHTDDAESQHRIGERAFWAILGMNPLLTAVRLYEQRGDIVAMRSVCFCAIAEREFREQVNNIWSDSEGEDDVQS